ncbi:MBL fold metallo-hydrolase [Vibrio hepatarius]|uniref:MBL fold metallo-hydrolase n=1 Tax=Vibrio hepatarius TaxID=171383 RepID=UPI001C081C0F|nr:MBL fold metallo-hydrolase [Vibrio hepatarius]MBU2899362.1 MBL fold metallo-hydrolase [Vibrio hepatarius]
MMTYKIGLLFLLSMNAFSAVLKEYIPNKSVKNGYVEPFQMFDDLYYVGDKWVSSYLVTTSDGLVLIDSLDSPYGRWIPQNIQKLGFNPKDIRYIFITHGHSDHVGSAEYIQRHFGAKVMMSSIDFRLAKFTAKNSTGDNLFLPPKVETFVSDNDELSVGSKHFKFYLTPGHTRGTLSLEFFVTDKGKSYRAFIVGGNGTNFTGFDLAEKYAHSVQRIRNLSLSKPHVEVNLASHPHMAQIFERNARYSQQTNPFIDQESFQEFLDVLEKRSVKKLAKEKKK